MSYQLMTCRQTRILKKAHDAFQGLGGEVRKELGFGLFGGMMVGRSKGEGR